MDAVEGMAQRCTRPSHDSRERPCGQRRGHPSADRSLAGSLQARMSWPDLSLAIRGQWVDDEGSPQLRSFCRVVEDANGLGESAARRPLSTND